MNGIYRKSINSIDKEWLEKVAEIVPNPFSAY